MPTVDIADKICSHCGNKKWYYRGDTISSTTYLECYQKRKEKSIERYQIIKNNPDYKAKKKIHIKNWRTANKEHVKKYKSDYNKTEKGKASKRRRGLSPIRDLRDGYIKQLILHNVPSFVELKDVSKEDIDLVKKSLSLKRKLKITRYQKESKILNIPEKVCPHCGDTRWRKEKYFTKTNPDSFRYRCVNLQNEYSKNYLKRKNDKEQHTYNNYKNNNN
jgi:hypothetical protein